MKNKQNMGFIRMLVRVGIFLLIAAAACTPLMMRASNAATPGRAIIVEHDIDLDLPNIGLKDPSDIVWPYEDQFTYQMHISGPFNPFEGSKIVDVESYYSDSSDIGTFKEVLEVVPPGMKLTSTASLEFNPDRTVSLLNTRHEAVASVSMPSLEGIDVTYKPTGNTMLVPLVGIELEVPSDGFLYFTGSDSPGALALALSAIDLDSGKPAEVWAFNGGDWVMQAPRVGIFRFTRVRISLLDESDKTLSAWYEKVRKTYSSWTPPDDVRPVILESLGSRTVVFTDDPNQETFTDKMLSYYTGEGPFAVAFIDAEGRVVRIEQPSALLGDTAELKTVGAGGAWWGGK